MRGLATLVGLLALVGAAAAQIVSSTPQIRIVGGPQSVVLVGDSITNFGAQYTNTAAITSTTAGASSFVLSSLAPASYYMQPGTTVRLCNASCSVNEQVVIASSYAPGTGGTTVTINGTLANSGQTAVYWYAGTVSGLPSFQGFSWAAIANARLGWPLDIVESYGLSGATTQQLLGPNAVTPTAYTDQVGNTTTQDWCQKATTVLDPVSGKPPRYVHIQMGANDITGAPAVSAANTITNITTCINEVLGAGITPIVGTLIPRADATMANAGWAAQAQVNNWIKQLARNDGRVIVVDYFRYLADPVTGKWLAGGAWGLTSGVTYTGDSIHPNTWSGAWYMASALVDALQLAGIANPVTYTTGSNDVIALGGMGCRPTMGDNTSINFDVNYSATFGGNPRGNLIGNAMLSNSVGSGTVADGWTNSASRTPSTGTLTLSVQARGNAAQNPFDRGYFQQVVAAQGAGTDYGSASFQRQDLASTASQTQGATTWQIGDTVTACATVKTSATGVEGSNNMQTYPSLSIDFYNASTIIGRCQTFPNGAPANPVDPGAYFSFATIRTRPCMIPANTTRMFYNFVLQGVGTMSFSDAALYKVAP